MRIKTEFWKKPIPLRWFDWIAYDYDSYDCDCDQDGYFSSCSIGQGATEAEAIQDLLEKIEEAKCL